MIYVWQSMNQNLNTRWRIIKMSLSQLYFNDCKKCFRTNQSGRQLRRRRCPSSLQVRSPVQAAPRSSTWPNQIPLFSNFCPSSWAKRNLGSRDPFGQENPVPSNKRSNSNSYTQTHCSNPRTHLSVLVFANLNFPSHHANNYEDLSAQAGALVERICTRRRCWPLWRWKRVLYPLCWLRSAQASTWNCFAPSLLPPDQSDAHANLTDAGIPSNTHEFHSKRNPMCLDDFRCAKWRV